MHWGAAGAVSECFGRTMILNMRAWRKITAFEERGRIRVSYDMAKRQVQIKVKQKTLEPVQDQVYTCPLFRHTTSAAE